MARVTIIERSYAQKLIHTKKELITESSINRCIDNLENIGFCVKNVQVVNYDDIEVERVIITYE